MGQKSDRFYTSSIKFDKRLYGQDIKGSKAHAQMLGKQGILTDEESKLIRVGYCIFSKLNHDPIHDMIAEIYGKSAIEIINTIISRGFISSLQHAGDMGIELHKAEIALKNNLNYIQDKDLIIK